MFKKQLPIIFIGLCVVVAVLVLGWAVFVKQEIVAPVKPLVVVDDNNQNNGSDEIIDDSSDVDDVVDDNNISKVDTSDWKTYTNEKYGYELKYPLNWFAYDYYYDGKKHFENIHIQNFSRPKEGGFSGIGGTGCQLGVWVESNKYSSVQEWVNVRKNNIGEDLEKVSMKEMEVGEAKGLEVTFFGEFLGTGDPAIIILNNGIIYKINESWQNVPQKNCQSAFDQMLSTFKFTNP